MNWTEGALSRHAHPRHNEAAKQREHFARARTSGLSSLAVLPPRSFAFLNTPPHRFQFPPPASSHKPAEHRPLPRRQTQQASSSLSSSSRTNTAPSTSAWSIGGKSKKRRASEMTGPGETSAEMGSRIKRLLKNPNWVGVNPAKENEPVRAQQEKKPVSTTPKVSPFFSATIPGRLTLSPVLPHHHDQTRIQPRVHIGNQSLLATSECSAELSSSSSLPVENQMSPPPRPPSPEPPRYQVSSSPASFHQPMPRRSLSILEMETRDISSPSAVATCGHDRSSSAIMSDPDVMEEWRSFLDLSSSVDPNHGVIQMASQPEEPTQISHPVSWSYSQSTNTIYQPQPGYTPPAVYPSGPSQAHRAPTPYIPPVAMPYAISSDPVSQAFSPPVACETGSYPQSVSDIASLSVASLPLMPHFFSQPMPLTFSNTMELSQQPIPVPVLPLQSTSHQANVVVSGFPTSSLEISVAPVDAPVFEDTATLQPLPPPDSKTSDDPAAHDAWLDFLFADAVQEVEAMTEAIQRASEQLVPSDSVDSNAAVGGSAISSSTPIPQVTTDFSSAIDSDAQIPAREFTEVGYVAGITESRADEGPSTDAQAASSSSGMFVGSTSPTCATVATGTSSLDLDPPSDQAQATDSPKEASTADKTFRFSQPKLFVGRLSSASGPSSASGTVGKRPQSGSPDTDALSAVSRARTKKRKRLRRSKSNDGRPDIRSLPDFYDDPIEE